MALTNHQSKHFVLVHGSCHGAWCWFKLKPLLEACGHRVSTVDLTASGINLTKIQHVATLFDYTLPLLDFMATLPPKEKVVLVGHSYGGLNIAVAMEKFPERVSIAIFLTAFMPDPTHNPSYVLDMYNEITPAEAWLDTQFVPFNDDPESEMSILFGPKFLSCKLYELCSDEDRELGKTLIRPSSQFNKDLKNAKR